MSTSNSDESPAPRPPPSDAPSVPAADEAELLARDLGERQFPVLALALRNATEPVLASWRAQSIKAMHELKRLIERGYGRGEGRGSGGSVDA